MSQHNKIYIINFQLMLQIITFEILFLPFCFFLFILFLHPFTFIVFHCFIYDSVFSYLLFITYIVWVNLFFPLNSSFNKQLKSSILRINVDYMLDFIVPFFLSLNILMIMMNNQNSILTIYYKFFFCIYKKSARCN